jgi:hypothetical protein
MSGKSPRDVAVVGAGPYGLACAAFMRHGGVDVQAFGRPMSYWAEQMPRGMLLRSRRRSSHIAGPRRALTIDAFERETGARLAEPIRLEDFVDYGGWYQRRAVPNLDPRMVERVERSGDGFDLTLAGGETPFPRRPAPLDSLPGELVSHSAELTDPAVFANRRVLVVGGGQSALESAALLAEAGADVEVIVRADGVMWLAGDNAPGLRARFRRAQVPPTDVGGRVSGWLAAAPEVYRRTPPALREEIIRRCTLPAGSAWLVDRLAAVPMTIGHPIVSATPTDSGVRVRLGDGSDRKADHVLLGTGFEIDVPAYGFLAPALVEALALQDGYPLLGPGFESNVPGLHFVGATAVRSFGPVMRFVVGTWYAAPVVARAALGRRQRVVRMAYKPRARLPRPVAQ